MTDTDKELFEALMKHVDRAEHLHPVFAEGIWQGLGYLQEELGEVTRAATHNEGEERLRAEILDLLVVCWRFARKDYEQPEEQA